MTREEAKAAYRERMMQVQADQQLRRAIAEKARLAGGPDAVAAPPEGPRSSAPERPPGA